MITLQTNFNNLDENYQISLSKRLNQKVAILEKYLKGDDYPFTLDFTCQQPKNSQYQVTFLFHLPNKRIHITKLAGDPLQALEMAFNPLKENTLQYCNKIKEQSRQVPTFTRPSQELELLETELATQDYPVEEFSGRLVPLLTHLKAYIQRRIRLAQVTGVIKPQSVSPDDAVEDVVELAYTQHKNRPSDLSLEHWLYTLADQVLDTKLQERTYEIAHEESLEQLIDKEIDDMHYTIELDAENSPHVRETTPFDEDHSYRILESLKVPDHSSQLDSSQQLRKVYKILATIPENKRSVFDLYVVDEFSEAEIARIKGMKKQQVHETIDEVIKNIKAKF